MRKPAVWLGTTTAILTGSPAAAQDAAPGWQHGPGMMWDGSWAWMMLLGPLMMILFVAAVVVLVVVALRWLGGHVSPAGCHAAAPGRPGRTPLDILKERFARGEIDKEEFEEGRRALGE